MHRVALGAVVVLLVGALAGAVALPVAAQDRSGGGVRVGDAVVVERNETTSGFTAVGRTVVVRGTVEGDLEAYAGNVVVTGDGRVTGRVRAYAGAVRINGSVGGTVLAYAGTVAVDEGGVVGGSFGAAAGSVVLAGTVRGDATVAAGAVTLAPSAHVAGDLTYNGDLNDEGGRVDGRVRKSGELGLAPSLPVLGPLVSAYLLLADALLGSLLLYAFPRFSWTAANTASAEPLRTAAVGLLALVAVPVALVVLAVTVVGIPLALAGLAGLLVLLWVGSVYGRFAVGSWLLSYAGVDNRWAALAAGFAAVAVVVRVPVPYLGPVVRLAVLLLGVGVVALGLRAAYEIVRDEPMGLSAL